MRIQLSDSLIIFLFQSDFLLRNRFQLRSQAVDTFGTQRSPLVLLVVTVLASAIMS